MKRLRVKTLVSYVACSFKHASIIASYIKSCVLLFCVLCIGSGGSTSSGGSSSNKRTSSSSGFSSARSERSDSSVSLSSETKP